MRRHLLIYFEFYFDLELMKIGIIADTHNYLTNIINSFNFFLEQDIKTVFHCGDWTKVSTFKFAATEAHKRGIELCGVMGNNDIEYKEQIYKTNEEIYIKITLPLIDDDYLVYRHKKRKFAIYHGDDKKRLEDILKSDNYEAIFIGHSHVPKEEFFLNTKVLNPGSLSFSIPFKKKGEELFTVGIYDLNKKRFEVYEI